MNPKLKGSLVFKTIPEYQKPIAPHNAIMKPIVAALPIAFLIGYPNILILAHSLLPQYPLVLK